MAAASRVPATVAAAAPLQAAARAASWLSEVDGSGSDPVATAQHEGGAILQKIYIGVLHWSCHFEMCFKRAVDCAEETNHCDSAKRASKTLR